VVSARKSVFSDRLHYLILDLGTINNTEIKLTFTGLSHREIVSNTVRLN
jgi:hypothetical protein